MGFGFGQPPSAAWACRRNLKFRIWERARPAFALRFDLGREGRMPSVAAAAAAAPFGSASSAAAGADPGERISRHEFTLPDVQRR